MTPIPLIAEMCHEVNRIWCLMHEDNSQYPWNEAPEWQKKSALANVRFHIDNPDASDGAIHDNWMRLKKNDGWIYGEIKDPEIKTHPCLVPFNDLPHDQQVKDRLFAAVVKALTS